MKYIEALTPYIKIFRQMNKEISIFLAGGITNCPNHQQELKELLKYTIPFKKARKFLIKRKSQEIVILNPRRKHFPIMDPNASIEQIEWEFEHFKRADIISFWFSVGSVNPIVLFELGKWLIQREKPIFIGIHPEYKRRRDVEIQVGLERLDIKIVYSLKDLANQIKNHISQL